MNTIDRVQTGLRLDRNIYKQLKANAKKNRQTFNKYVEEVLKNFLDDDFPRIPPDHPISPEILEMGKLMPHYTEEELAQDDRLRYILSKGQETEI
ncbi:MAG: hypothetical protein GX125_07965 [Bacteroidales bacterium]|jgi:hypothetical protein|nr:hypothetical protein [Bacteroidota bacterium]NLO00178.1 hypothetical protein [Bacteroidales bacterium]